MDLRSCIGKRVVDVKVLPGNSVTLVFDDRSEFTARQGDSGSMRSPEPYFVAELLAADECRAWGSFGPCGQKLPCQFHPVKP